MLELLNEWQDGASQDVFELAAEAFDADGQNLRSAGVVAVEKVGYAEETDMFLVRVRFSGEYTHFDRDGIGGPADADFNADLWVALDDARSEVLDAEPDLLGGFLN